MGKATIFAGLVTFVLLGAAMGYVLASAYLTLVRGGTATNVDFLYLVQAYPGMGTRSPDQFRTVNLLVGGGGLAGLLLSAVLMTEA